MAGPEDVARSIEAVEADAAEEVAKTYEDLAAAEELMEGALGEGGEPASDDLELLAELEGVVPPQVVPDAELTPGETAPFVMPFDDEVLLLPEYTNAWATEADEEYADARLRSEFQSA